MSEHKIVNPFFLDSNKIINPDTEEYIDKTRKNIFTHYKYIYIVCLSKPIPLKQDYFNREILEKDFNEFSKNIILYRAPIEIIQNSVHYEKVSCKRYEHLELYNIFGYEMDDFVLYFPILNIPFLQIQNYINFFLNTITLKNLYHSIVIGKYFQNNYISYSKFYFLKEGEFWEKNSFDQNYNYEFETRFFNINKSRKKITSSGDYLDEIYHNKDYLDASIIVKDNEEKFTFKKGEYTNDQILDLLKNIDEKKRIILLSRLITSLEYFSILNDKNILDFMKYTIKKYTIPFRYILSYNWILFYIKEGLHSKQENITLDDDFVFTLDTASNLPIYPFVFDDPYLNPYFVMFSDYENLNVNKNISGISSYNLKEKIIYGGLATLDEFKRNMKIFITGDSTLDIFDGFDFKKYKTYIAGSIMTACAQKFNPLITLFKKSNQSFINDYTTIFNRYLQEYYATSDIDVIIDESNTYNFITTSIKLYDVINKNLNYPFTTNKLEIEISSITFFNDTFLNEFIVNDDISLQHLIPWIINDDGNDDMWLKTIFSIYIKILYDEELENIKKLFPEDYPETEFNNLFDFKLENVKFKYYNCKMNSVVSKFVGTSPDLSLIKDYVIDITPEKIEKFKKFANKPKLYINVKSKINMYPFINHSFEIFANKKQYHPINMVSKFHLPCVRALYNGENVYMLPSFITAQMTFMNTDFKYQSGNNDPIYIINKYKCRGYGIYLNKNEKKKFMKYIIESEFWNNLYNISSYTNINNKIFNVTPFASKIFQPRLWNIDYYVSLNLEPIIQHEDNYEIVSVFNKFAHKYDYNEVIRTIYQQCKDSEDYYKINNKKLFTAINEKTGKINKLSKKYLSILFS
jgi:hypothetical protein